MLRWFAASLCCCVLLVGQSRAGEQTLPSTDPRCFKEDHLLVAATRDGFQIQAEARSETPISRDARVYFVANKEHREFGVIASSEESSGTTTVQCNWGKGSEVHIESPSEAVHHLGDEPFDKLSRRCRPLDEYLHRLERGYLEVPFRRFTLNPEFDSLITRSPRTGSWSLLLIDKRGPPEVACFSNWGRDFRVPGESPGTRSAALSLQ